MILIFSILPITIIGLMSYEIAKQNLISMTFSHLERMAEAEESRITDVLDADFSTIDSIASRTALREHINDYNSEPSSHIQERIFQIIDDAHNSIKNVVKIQIYSINGNIISDSNSNMDTKNIESEFRRISEPSKTVKILKDDSNSILKVFRTNLDLDGEVIGYMLVYYDPHRLFSAEMRGFGQTGEYLLGKYNDQNNIEIFIGGKESITVRPTENLPMFNALHNIESQIIGVDYKNDKVFAFTKNIEEPKLGLVVKVNESEALQVLNNLTFTVVMIILLIILVTSIVTLASTRSFMQPIYKLREHTKKIAQGQYEDEIVLPEDEDLKTLYLDIQYMRNELKQREESLRKENELKEQFVNIAAHELKTPIQPIINYAKLALKGWADKDDSLKIIEEEGNILQRLTNNILDVSRINSGTYKFNFKETRLNQLIKQVVQQYRKTIRKDISIKLELSDDIKVEADEEKIIQVFENIIGNAIKFMDKGEISIKTLKQKNTVKIIIEDTAGGIPDEMLPKLFTKFATKSVKEGTDEGTGLGLFLSKIIVDAHKGTITGQNNNHGGATFVITLPVYNKN